jgi:predicted GIY-YIG superfamily endonuclease
MSKVQLFRPVGQAELDLIAQSGWKKFPPRLPSQPIFYPVANEEYAIRIAKNWNAKYEGIGYVTLFWVKEDFLSSYPIQTVGSSIHQEYWIPAEELEAFNEALVEFPPSHARIWQLHKFEQWHIYILRCADDTLYTGITNDLNKRIEQHNKGEGAKYTRGRGPVSLMKSFQRFTKGEALKLERKIKKLSREEKLKYNDERETSDT